MEQVLERPARQLTEFDEDWRLIEPLLPAGWIDKARQLGAFRPTQTLRVKDPAALLRMMLIHLGQGIGLGASGKQGAAEGIAQLSHRGMMHRLLMCGAWFEWMTQQLRASPDLAPPPPCTTVLAGRRLRLIDGHVVRERWGNRIFWWRLHYSITLPSLHCESMSVAPSDDDETFERFDVHPTDIFLADRGYAHPSGIAHVLDGGGDVLLRINLDTLRLLDPETGLRLNIITRVRQLRLGQAGLWPAQVVVPAKPGSSGSVTINGHLCALKKSNEAALKERMQIKESKRKDTRLWPNSLEAAGYVLVFTSLTQLQADQIMDLYRQRWQMELEFKRLKSLIALGPVKFTNQPGSVKLTNARAAQSWLQGKLLVALLSARLTTYAERCSPWGYEVEPFQAPNPPMV